MRCMVTGRECVGMSALGKMELHTSNGLTAVMMSDGRDVASRVDRQWLQCWTLGDELDGRVRAGGHGLHNNNTYRTLVDLLNIRCKRCKVMPMVLELLLRMIVKAIRSILCIVSIVIHKQWGVLQLWGRE